MESILSEIRLIAVRDPETSWGIQNNPIERPKVLARGEPSDFRFFHVGPMRGEPDKRMIYRPVLFPEYASPEEWTVFLKDIELARLKEPLYREDFENPDTMFL